jgi:hypothetical protein
MADSILIDYVSTLLRTKGGGANLDHAASVLSDAASLIHLLDAQNEDNAPAISELCTKAKSLAQSKSPSQKTAGLNALTVFAEQGSRAVFLANFVEWSTEALAALKTSSSPSDDVVNASWRLMAAIFRRSGRLLHIPGVRRDAAPLANKLTAAIAQAAEKSSLVTSELAFLALRAALLAVPTSFKPHMKTLEPVVSRAMLSSSSNSSSSASSPPAAILCFAALPRAGGDASDWSAAAQRLFVSAHSLLDQAYLGLEPSGLVDNCRQGLDSTATLLPGVVDSSANTTATGGMDSYALTFGQLEAILSCLEAQLTTTFPTPIPLPSSPLLLLSTRILSVDADSVAERSAASTGKLAELCLRLPALHSRALGLLKTLTLVAGVQLTPFLLSVARTLGDQLGKVAVDPAEIDITKLCPSVKIALYEATAVVLRAGGVAAARQLAPVILQCAYVELYGIAAPNEKGAGAHLMSNTTGRRGGAIEAQPARKRAKQAKHRGDDFINIDGSDNAGSIYEIASLRSQSAFLSVLEALLEAGASLLTFGQRARADDIVAHAACTAADAALKAHHTAEGGDAAPLVPLQLASLKALLASILAPASYRPPHVSLALNLFRNGVRHQSANISQFCSHALLCCEALMHPRSLPRPAPLQRNSAGAAGTTTADASGVLGMPHFWSFIDADAWLKLQQAQQKLALAEEIEATGNGEIEDEMEMEDDDAGKRKRKTSSLAAQKKRGGASGGFLNAATKPAQQEKDDKPAQQPVAAKPAPVLAPLPKITPKVVASNPKAAAAVAAPMPLRAAAGDESDDESLPEIDSGASSDED